MNNVNNEGYKISKDKNNTIYISKYDINKELNIYFYEKDNYVMNEILEKLLKYYIDDILK